MSYESWLLTAMGLFLAGHLAERMLLDRIWQENPCWANSMRLPPSGMAVYTLRSMLAYYRAIAVFEPNLRKSKGSLGLLLIAWAALVLGLSSMAMGAFLMSPAQPSVAG